MPDFPPDLADIARRLIGREVSTGTFIPLDDAALLAVVEELTLLRHEVERCQAIAVAEVARRSRVPFGVRGLAQRTGHAGTGQLVQSITRSSKREAVALVRVGQMMAETDAAAALEAQRWSDPMVSETTPAPTTPWFAALGAAVAEGVVTVEVAGAIRSGLGEPGGDADEAALVAALPMLVDECRSLHADAARRAARQTRDRIDAAGVVARAERQRHHQYWRVWVKPDGMVRGEFELEPQAGMLVKAVFDQLTHPRRLDAKTRRGFGDHALGDARYADARATRERDAAEGLVQLLRAGASVDPSRLLDERKPSVRVVVNAHALATGEGTGMIEGHPDRIPVADIHPGLCEGHLPVKFGDGTVLDLGRDERLFTERQKIALTVRDGGCMDPDCTRPPSWTEAHHIDHWHRDGGRTDLADGILLCRGDHLRYHNEGWEVRREGARYWLIPPPGVDPERTPRSMRSKTPSDILNPVDPTRLPMPGAPPVPRLVAAAGEREPARPAV
ncbi:HNH endonuclease signature motif containing protein [Agromyces bauzanensis]|uniref:HNH nuclease domain-containing protein n=1 Tax=Agromyces bauzanensis TaxID=1308924 RepID=A0A917PJ70_9MICO|nr:HNH endonuclease signature motif containing protein [Agromyces bauzanensis]GGJ80973.1 hypothetical protein GCM10011372_19270 [Agromyces bauzanensis]